MAVFDRQYQPWEGVRTEPLRRLLVLPRYSYRGIFSSKLFTAFFSLAFIPTLVAAGFIWLRTNVPLLQGLGLDAGEIAEMPGIDGRFFLYGLYFQLWFAAAITLLQGPALVSPDLVNGALPLYLSRPITRAQYVLGKFLVLALLLSAVTWVPLSFLFFLHGSLTEGPWVLDNLRLLMGVFVGSVVAISVFSLFALALSAWVKNKAFARALVGAFLVIPAGVGEVFNEALDTRWGRVLNLFAVLDKIGAALLGVRQSLSMPLAGAVASLVVVAALCLFLLHRRLRAFEVVR
jgi:ABC-2 type transport system permease protein